MRNTKNGTYNGEPTYCPVNCQNHEDCPYAENGLCHMEDPNNSCEDWQIFWADWDEWENS